MTEEYKWKALEKRVIKFDPEKDPHGWIQWKGTEVCIDIRCVCGETSHYDGDFMYFIKCPACGMIYEANGHIELIPLKKGEEKIVNSIQEAE